MTNTDCILHLGEQKVYIGDDHLREYILPDLKEHYNKVLLVVDKNFWLKNGKGVNTLLKKELGEKYIGEFMMDAHTTTKNLLSVHFLLEYFHSMGVNRKSCVLAVGGGYVGDLVGVATGMYMRGIGFCQIPSTLMSQCDAVIGKVGVNLGSYKNVVGLFRSPELIFCNIGYLKGLPVTERLLGLPEIVKHLLITYDDNAVIMNKSQTYLDLIETGVTQENKQDRINMIKESLEIKYSFAQPDPYDVSGSHKGLSLGHTFANVFETLIGRFRHGDAVMLGIVMCLSLSAKMFGNEKIMQLKEWFIDLVHVDYTRLSLSRETIKSVLQQDKISMNGELSFVLLEDLGHHVVKKDCPEILVKEVFSEFISLYE